MSQLPAYLQNMSAEQKSELKQSFRPDEVKIPRLKLLQAQTPACMPGPDYVEGAQAGKFLNTVTNEVLPGLRLVIIKMVDGWSVFKHKDSGGGLVGTYELGSEIEQFIDTNEIKNTFTHGDVTYEAIRTWQCYAKSVNKETGEMTDVILDMPATSRKVAKTINTMIMTSPHPQTSIMFFIGTKMETNDQGSWFIPEVLKHNFVTEEQFKIANESFKAMSTMSVLDTSFTAAGALEAPATTNQEKPSPSTPVESTTPTADPVQAPEAEVIEAEAVTVTDDDDPWA